MIVGEVVAKLIADTASWKRGFNEATASAQKFSADMKKAAKEVQQSSDEAGSAVGKMARTFTQTAASTAAGIGLFKVFSSVTQAAKSAVIDFNSTMEQSSIAFKSMLGSQSAADIFMNKVIDFATKTPFELQQLVPLTQQMIAFGFKSSEVFRDLAAIGDTISAKGMGSYEMQMVIRDLGQIMAKGKLAGQEVIQLSNLGINAFQMIADATGKTVSEIQKLSEQGMISASTAVESIISQMEKQYGGMMEKQMGTLRGAASNLNDYMQRAVGAATKPVYNALRDTVVAMSNFLGSKETMAWTEKFAANMQKTFSGLQQSLTEFFKGHQTELVEFKNAVVDVWHGFLGLVDASKSVVTIFKQLAGTGVFVAFKTLTEVLAPIARLMAENATAAKLLVGAYAAFKFAQLIEGVNQWAQGLILARLQAANAATSQNLYNVSVRASAPILSGATSALAGFAAKAMIAVTALTFLRQRHQEAAAEFAKGITGHVDTTDIKDIQRAIADAQKELDKLNEKRGKGALTGSLPIVGRIYATSGDAKRGNEIDALEKKIADLKEQEASLIDIQKKQVDQTNDVTSAAEKLSLALATNVSDYDTLNKAAQDYTKALFDHTRGMADVQQAFTGFANVIAGMQVTGEKDKKTMADLMASAESARGAIETMATAILSAGGGAGDMAEAMAAAIQAFYDAGEQAGFTRDQIDEVLKAMGILQANSEIQLKVTADTSQAIAAIAQVIALGGGDLYADMPAAIRQATSKSGIDFTSQLTKSITSGISKARSGGGGGGKDPLQAERDYWKMLVAIGEAGLNDYIDVLNNQLAHTKKYSDAWYAVWQEIKTTTDTLMQQQQDRMRAEFELGDLAAEKYAAMLQTRLSALEKYSSEYMSVWNELKSVEEDAKRSAEQAVNSRYRFGEIDPAVKAIADSILNGTNPDLIFGLIKKLVTGSGSLEDLVKSYQPDIAGILNTRDFGPSNNVYAQSVPSSVTFNQTFQERVDPIQVSAAIGWELGL